VSASPNRTRLVGYIRVSTERQARRRSAADRQAEDGVSLEAQRTRLVAYSVAMDVELVTIIDDPGKSAKSLNRPGMVRALAMLEAGEADGLLIPKLDRLTRSVRDLGDLVERYFASRFALVSVGDSIDTRSASGRLVLNVLVSVAQWEREAGAERTREALAQVKAEGGRIGRPGLGWTRTEDLDEHGRRAVVADPAEAKTVARIQELRHERFSLMQIATTLTDEGHRTKRGGEWYPSTVRSVLAREGGVPSPVGVP
jgi:DNA invertase Pin-like site-specific DNA recombinase